VDFESTGGTGRDDLVELDQDHPGFRDADYRRRRNEIARVARDYRDGDPVPEVEYTEEEHEVWREVWRQLQPLHDERACKAFLECSDELALRRDRVPQFSVVNEQLKRKAGFRLWPVAGLVSPRTFLEYLGDDVFLATQYIRHHSRPLYTPEPDVVHELVGHAATLIHPQFVELNRLFGAAVKNAGEGDELALIRVYWWTIEFGLAREDGRMKAYGAGLLSSFGELGTFEDKAELLPLDIDVAAATPFDPTDYQRTLFVAESFEKMFDDVGAWLRRMAEALDNPPLKNPVPRPR
jgi:phenylalanine-4-hydroxylase